MGFFFLGGGGGGGAHFLAAVVSWMFRLARNIHEKGKALIARARPVKHWNFLILVLPFLLGVGVGGFKTLMGGGGSECGDGVDFENEDEVVTG